MRVFVSVVEFYVNGCSLLLDIIARAQFAPLASDIGAVLDDRNPLLFELGHPPSPMLQLMSVLPPESGSSLPAAYAALMTTELRDCFPRPSEWSLDVSEARFLHQAIPLLPFIDTARVATALQAEAHTLTPSERARDTLNHIPLLYCSTLRLSSAPAPASLSVPASSAVASAPEWACPVCTYANQPLHLQCAICLTQQPATLAHDQVPDSDDVAAAAAAAAGVADADGPTRILTWPQHRLTGVVSAVPSPADHDAGCAWSFSSPDAAPMDLGAMAAIATRMHASATRTSVVTEPHVHASIQSTHRFGQKSAVAKLLRQSAGAGGAHGAHAHAGHGHGRR